MPGLRLGVGLDAALVKIAGNPVLAGPTVAQMTTATETTEGDADMITWAAAAPLVVDQYGKWILWIQYFRNADSTKYHIPVVSNDGGATWTAPARTGFFNANGDIVLIRGAVCYDAANDLMHGCWALTQADGGVYYRQYSFTRDGSHNITGVTRTRQMQLEIGVGGMDFESPHALMSGTTLVLAWGALNPAEAVKAAVRATALVPVGGAADVLNASWTAPLNENAGLGVTSDPLASSFPAGQRYSVLAQSTGNQMPYSAIGLLASGDLGILVAVTTGGTPTVYWNRARYDAGNADWRTGLKTALASDTGDLTVESIGTSGYSLKYQLMGKLAQAGSGDVGIAYPVYTGGADAVRLASITLNAGSADTLNGPSTVYSAGGTHSYAPTCDIAWDATAARWVVTYIKTTSQFAYFKTYTAARAADQGETAIDAAHPVDIPYVHGERVNGKTVFYHRDTTSRVLPDKFYGWWGSAAWS